MTRKVSLIDEAINHPLTVLLCGTAPIISSPFNYIRESWHFYTQERVKEFCRQTIKGVNGLTEEELKSEPVLQMTFLSFEALKTARDKNKIELLSAIYNKFCLNKAFENIDEYEDALKISSEISPKEFQLLLMLKYRQYKWEKFFSEVEKQLDIPGNEVSSWLNRLIRTGLVVNSTDFDNAGYVDCSPLLDKFLDKLDQIPESINVISHV